jgi:hypothetical protein
MLPTFNIYLAHGLSEHIPDYPSFRMVVILQLQLEHEIALANVSCVKQHHCTSGASVFFMVLEADQCATLSTSEP